MVMAEYPEKQYLMKPNMEREPNCALKKISFYEKKNHSYTYQFIKSSTQTIRKFEAIANCPE